jgi:hypothetical protein
MLKAIYVIEIGRSRKRRASSTALSAIRLQPTVAVPETNTAGR